MLYLRDKHAPQRVCEIADTDAAWLLAQLELVSAEVAEFYLTVETVDALTIAGASDPLLETLAALLDNRDAAEVDLVHRLSDDVYAPVVLRQPETQAGRAVDELRGLDEMTPAHLATIDEVVDGLLPGLGVAAEPQAGANDVPEPWETAKGPEGKTVEVAGRELSCVVCGMGHFYRRPLPLPDAALGSGSNAECYVCVNCMYMHWFAR